MNPRLIQAVAQSQQQDLLSGAEKRRLARELPCRPSRLARLMSAIPSPTRARSTELPQAGPAAVTPTR